MDRDNNSWYNGNQNQQNNINIYEQSQTNSYNQQSMTYQQQMQGQHYQNMEQQPNIYQQQGQIYGEQPNMYQQQIPLTPPIKSKKDKPKKKKKHKLLRFLLKTAIFILLIIGVIKGSNYLAEKEFSKVVSAYPFKFNNETNSLNYITDNFSVTTQYELDGKTYKVKWKADDKSLKISDDGEVTVTRPTNSSKTIILTETYKKLLGKATREYKVNVICTGIIDKESINVITLDNIKNGEYNRKMTASMTTDGNQLDFMVGDFKDTYINSVDDALVLLDAYKSEFKTPDNVTFILDKITNTNINTSYIFNMYSDGIKIDNKAASVVVENETFKLKKIAIDSVNITKINEIEHNLSSLTAQKGEELSIDTSDFIVLNEQKLLNDNGILYKYIILFKDNNVYEVKIQNNEVLSFENMTNTVICTGVNEKNELLTFDASYDNNLYNLQDKNRNIIAY